MKFIVEGMEFDNYEQAQAYEQKLKAKKESEMKEKAEKAKDLYDYIKANSDIIQVQTNNGITTLVSIVEQDKEKVVMSLLWDMFGQPYRYAGNGKIVDSYSLVKLDRRKKDTIIKQYVEYMLGIGECPDFWDSLYFRNSDTCSEVVSEKIGAEKQEPSFDEFVRTLLGM